MNKYHCYFKIFFVLLLPYTFSCSKSLNEQVSKDKIPVIYSEHYNIKLFGIQKLHPFDTEKPDKIHRFLKNEFNLSVDQFYEPLIVKNSELLKVHTKHYLKSLNSSRTISEIAEIGPLKFLPPSMLKRKILRPMKYSTGGTLLSVDIAVKKGLAVNLSGGYHHAKANSGEGFSFYADINLAVNKLKEKYNKKSIMIVDLDAHQGNGYESIIKDDTCVHIFDIYNEDIFPNDNDVKKYIDYNLPISKFTTDVQYLKILENELPKAIEISKPDFIIFNAGTDVFLGDVLGMLTISENGIIERDEFVFKCAYDNNIPLIMLLSGGYSRKSANITSESIANILKKFYF